MKRKLKAERTNGWLQASQVVDGKVLGEKADRSKETKGIELMVESLFARIIELQDHGAATKSHGKMCTRVSLRRATDSRVQS